VEVDAVTRRPVEVLACIPHLRVFALRRHRVVVVRVLHELPARIPFRSAVQMGVIAAALQDANNELARHRTNEKLFILLRINHIRYNNHSFSTIFLTSLHEYILLAHFITKEIQQQKNFCFRHLFTPVLRLKIVIVL